MTEEEAKQMAKRAYRPFPNHKPKPKADWDNTDGLAKAATLCTVSGAANYLRVHKLQADNDLLAECLKRHLQSALPKALADAKEALECGMDAVAEETFKASMVLAGINAAKEATTKEKELDLIIDEFEGGNLDNGKLRF